eukprot:892550-Prorocentrum_lima.AAC.1
MASTALRAHELVLDDFCMRQFNDVDPSYTGTKVLFDPQQFEALVNEHYEKGGKALVDGYAPFCKHLFVPNFAGVRKSTLEITPENEALLRSAYEARTPQELPVLSRYFPLDAIGE